MTLDRHFDELREGERFTTRGRTITESDVVGFAGLTGDSHPQHTDAEWSAGSRFGERIAHGMLVLSYAVGLMPFEPERVVAIRRIGDAVFKQPTRIGDTIRVEVELADRRELDDENGLVSCRWRILNQHDKLVARAKVEVVWKRELRSDPAQAEPDRQPVLI
ncbi:MAG TPA: MaoC/PaaZ C-terminal domain-containing protein [Thermoleophilaceae bacterium]|jgi:acyl dehydratase